MLKKAIIGVLVILLLLMAAGCTKDGSTAQSDPVQQADATAAATDQSGTAASGSSKSDASTGTSTTSNNSEQFTDRDLEQTADLTDAVSYTVSDGETVRITAEGVYVLRGTAADATVWVEAEDSDRVQLVLDGLTITNDSFPCIYVVNADKVFITTTDSDNSLTVTGTFRADGSTSTDAVVFSRDDLVFNGTGTLTITSSDNGVSSKDDVKITGGTLNISSASDAIEAKESIRIAGGVLNIVSRKDGLHAEDDEDNTVGYVYICAGTLTIQASDDGIHATTEVQIDGGSLKITAAEGIEGTRVLINDGEITISASDDGINGARKTTIYTPEVAINGGSLSITMGSGDTDGIDCNGNLTITGGTVSVNGQFPFDYDGTLTWTGGTVIVNGEEVNSISNQTFSPGGGMGGPGGRR